MKLIRYTLNKDDTIPDFVIDGGYFPKPNGGKSPQDYDLIGYFNKLLGKKEFISKEEFESEIKSYNIDKPKSETDKTEFIITDLVSIFWDGKRLNMLFI